MCFFQRNCINFHQVLLNGSRWEQFHLHCLHPLFGTYANNGGKELAGQTIISTYSNYVVGIWAHFFSAMLLETQICSICSWVLLGLLLLLQGLDIEPKLLWEMLWRKSVAPAYRFGCCYGRAFHCNRKQIWHFVLPPWPLTPCCKPDHQATSATARNTSILWDVHHGLYSRGTPSNCGLSSADSLVRSAQCGSFSIRILA